MIQTPLLGLLSIVEDLDLMAAKIKFKSTSDSGPSIDDDIDDFLK